MSKKINVIIADDHPLFRKGLKQIIENESCFEITGEAGNGEDALEMIGIKKPDIAVLDVSMPGKTGLEIVKTLNKSGNSVKIIFLTMHKEEFLFNEAMDQGVKGYVLKENASEDIIDCLKLVANDDYAISPVISNYLINRRQINNTNCKKNMHGIENLTASEKKILNLISKAKSTKEIAGELGISVKTVEVHRTHISQKLNLQGNLSLVKYALENKTVLQS